jgi:hypothetical protein
MRAGWLRSVRPRQVRGPRRWSCYLNPRSLWWGVVVGCRLE